MPSHLTPVDALAPPRSEEVRDQPEPLTAAEAEELTRDLVGLTRSLFALVLPARPTDTVTDTVTDRATGPASPPPAPRPVAPASVPMPASVPPSVPLPASIPASVPPPADRESVPATPVRGPEPIQLPAEPVRPERAREERTMSLLDEIGFLDD